MTNLLYINSIKSSSYFAHHRYDQEILDHAIAGKFLFGLGAQETLRQDAFSVLLSWGKNKSQDIFY